MADHGNEDRPPAPRFNREEGLFVSADAAGEELRLHRDEKGRYEVVRWRRHPDGGWLSPMVFWFAATEIHDMHYALVRQAEQVAAQRTSKR